MTRISLLLAAVVSAVLPCVAGSGRFPEAGRFTMNAPLATAGQASPVTRAIDHFRDRQARLEATSPAAADATKFAIHVGQLDQEPRLQAYFSPEKIEELTRNLKPLQKEQAYMIARVEVDGQDLLIAGGLSPLGTVYAISELEVRLRTSDDGGVFIALPEWETAEVPDIIVGYPAIETRGEYLNVGYQIPPITPHEWDLPRWQSYIDNLVLAKLNRFYFYLWTNAYTINPASELSQNPLNQRLHENLRAAIAYAQGRGLEVVYMFCPTFFPKDLWDANPGIHAEIEYVDHGFPAVCPNAPGAWELMMDNARSEMHWFSEADAIQLWFYDPGGCWCEKNGCNTTQAESLARQVSEFGALFRTFNPTARIEFNLWPIWVWEDLKKFTYRDAVDEQIKQRFPEDYRTLTAVGGDNATISFPLREQEMGFQTATFLFGTNQESGYVFTLPNLRWMSALIKEVRDKKLGGAFGHRLEAWTRYPGTYFMGELLWNPDALPADVVRRWADWQSTRPEAGEHLAGVMMALDQFTDEGASAAMGEKMTADMQALWPTLPPCAQADLEYLPPMVEALRIVGESVGVEEHDQLDAYAADFTRALEQSPTFSTLAADGSRYFQRYRTLLTPGWYAAPF